MLLRVFSQFPDVSNCYKYKTVILLLMVLSNDELIQFTDLKKGTRISMRLWIKEKTLYNDMDRLDIVTLIQCC